MVAGRSSATAGARLRFQRALRGSAVALVGRNPWPGAGRPGHAVAMLLALVALVFLAGTAGEAALGRQRLYGYYQNDFIAYLTGAALLARGHVQQLYQGPLQLQVQTELLASVGDSTPSLIAYMNPPLWAGLVLPLATLGVLGSAWLWRVLSLTGTALVLLRIARDAAPGTTQWRGTLLLLGFFPFLQSWQYGNMGAVLLGAVGGWLVLARRNRPFAAGLALSLLLLKPQYLLVPGAFLAWKRQWRQLAGMAAGVMAQALLTLALYLAAGTIPTLDTLREFLNFTAMDSARLLEGQVTLRSALRFLWPALTPSGLELPVLALATALLGASILVFLGRTWRPGEARFGWEILALMVLANLTALHNQFSGLALLLAPAALLLAPTARPRSLPADRPSARPGLSAGRAREGSGSIPIREKGLASPHPLVARPGGAEAALLGVLALPSIGVLLMPVSFWFYVASNWLTALGALGLALLSARRA